MFGQSASITPRRSSIPPPRTNRGFDPAPIEFDFIPMGITFVPRKRAGGEGTKSPEKFSACPPVRDSTPRRRRNRAPVRHLQLACHFEPLESRQLMSAVVLTAPSGLTASAAAHDMVKLHWQTSAAPAKGYEILRSTDGTHYSQIAAIKPITANSYKDTTAQPGTVYSYMIESFKGAKTSGASNVVSASMPLTPVSNLTASAAGPTSVQLNWQDNAAATRHNMLLRSTDGVDFAQIAKGKSGSTSSYLDTTVVFGQSYEYEVKAANASMTAAALPRPLSLPPLATPTTLAAAFTGSSINLTWTDNDPSATGYEVLRSTDKVNYSSITTLTSATANSYTDSNRRFREPSTRYENPGI